MSDAVIELARALIRIPSVTPEDGGCQDLIAQRLEAAGFTVERMRFGEVDNLWALRGDEPRLCFAGHTDVVPPGPETDWTRPPYSAEIADGVLHGRGAADMKGSLAAMVVAAERLVASDPDAAQGLCFLITSDEEGPARDGTRRVIEALSDRGTLPRWCVVGEPSSRERLGDMIRIGRRGSLTGELVVQGVQGHVAYPDQADNPIHRIAPVLAELVARRWDEGGGGFPATSFQITSLESGIGADNVIPGTARLGFNFRYNPCWTAEGLQSEVEASLERAGLDHSLDWRLSGEPFLTEEPTLPDAVSSAVEHVLGIRPRADTGGGTSDGRFIAPAGVDVVELGPVNATIHQTDERTAVEELRALAEIYARIALELGADG